MVRALIVIVAAVHGTAAQTDSDQELLGRIRQHVGASVAGLSNYTCQETMDRSIYSPAGQIEFRERLRLDVLVTAAGELFAWPGSTDFSIEPVENWIEAGAISTGNFEVEIHNLFMAFSATMKYAGLETRDQPLYRFDFHAPLLGSRHIVAVNGKSAATAYSGSFWVNKDSLDLIRLDTRAEEIPTDLDCREAHESVSYGRVRLGVDERLLPSAAELVLVRRDGREGRNSVAFSGCRHYTTDTSISFNAAPDPETPALRRPRLELPAGVTLALRLEEPISTRESAAGDQIVALLDKAATTSSVPLPKGTRVLGRIRRLEQHFGKNVSTLIGLQFFAAETPNGRGTFSARLTGPRATPDVVKNAGLDGTQEIVRGEAGLEIEDDGASTGVGSFRVRGKELHLPRGFRMLWKTQ